MNDLRKLRENDYWGLPREAQIQKYFKKSSNVPIIGGMEDFGRMWFTFLCLAREIALQTKTRDGKCATNRKHLEVEDWPDSILMCLLWCFFNFFFIWRLLMECICFHLLWFLKSCSWEVRINTACLFCLVWV